MPIKDLGKVINLANYTIELGHYLTDVLGYEITDVSMTLAQTNILLNTDPNMYVNQDKYKSLLDPTSMAFFFEAYKYGNFDSIRQRYYV
jgi:hypothetical protein